MRAPKTISRVASLLALESKWRAAVYGAVLFILLREPLGENGFTSAEQTMSRPRRNCWIFTSKPSKPLQVREKVALQLFYKLLLQGSVLFLVKVQVTVYCDCNASADRVCLVSALTV
jgi:hypothetical protein